MKWNSSANSHWKPAAHAFSECEDDGRKFLIVQRIALVYDKDWKPVQRRVGRYRHIEAYHNGMFLMLGEDLMRWQPKPSVIFTRKDHGTIAVIGNEVLQFDLDWNKTISIVKTTHLEALQQALLMIGAMS